MAADDEMTIDEREKYRKRMRSPHRAADHAGRSRLLSEMEAVTGQHAASLLRPTDGDPHGLRSDLRSGDA